MSALRRAGLLLTLALGADVTTASAQQPDRGRAAVLAVTDSVLAAINRGDNAAIAELMLPEAFTLSLRDSSRYATRTRDQLRAQQARGTVIERGFRPTVHVSGPIAVVWLPYDLHVNGAWSHCGIDVFTLVRRDAGWRVATLAWSIEQPPACERHPDGPPRAR